MRWLVALALVSGCVATSQVGPYVKHVQRNGDWLIIHKCMIILEGEEIHEGQCSAEQVPLGNVPIGPMPGQPMPGQPMPGQPTPSQPL